MFSHQRLLQGGSVLEAAGGAEGGNISELCPNDLLCSP